MRNIAQEAAYYREALRLGACIISDVITWSDSVLAESDEPRMSFIDLSMMGQTHSLEVLRLLNQLSKGIRAISVLPTVLAAAHDRLVLEPDYGPSLAKGLYDIYVSEDGSVPDELNLIGWFDDQYSLAQEGIYSEHETYQRLLDFTAGFKV